MAIDICFSKITIELSRELCKVGLSVCFCFQDVRHPFE